MTSCPEERHGKEKLLDPFVPLLVSIADTVCDKGMKAENDGWLLCIYSHAHFKILKGGMRKLSILIWIKVHYN